MCGRPDNLVATLTSIVFQPKSLCYGSVEIWPNYNVQAMLCEHCVKTGTRLCNLTKRQCSGNVVWTLFEHWYPTLKSDQTTMFRHYNVDLYEHWLPMLKSGQTTMFRQCCVNVVQRLAPIILLGRLLTRMTVICVLYRHIMWAFRSRYAMLEINCFLNFWDIQVLWTLSNNYCWHKMIWKIFGGIIIFLFIAGKKYW